MRIFTIIFFIFSFICLAKKPDQRPFVIDICSYNNARWYKKNLDSVFKQKYTNYRVVYTDDVSSDGTADLVEKYVRDKGQEGRFKLIRNPIRSRQLANHYRVIHGCTNDEIIIHLDGDDWFSHDKVLEKINEVYVSNKVWMTYGNYTWWPTQKIDFPPRIPREVVAASDYRLGKFRKGAFHPRSFYAWLAKRIKLRDLIFPQEPFKGKFVPAVADWALMYPMFEMADRRFRCIREILYIYNYQNPINHAKMKNNPQAISGKYLRDLDKYLPLRRPTYGNFNKGLVPIVYFDNSNDSEIQKIGSKSYTSVKNNQNAKTQLFPLLKNKRYIYLAFSKPFDIKQSDLKKYADIIEKTREEGFYLGVDSKIFDYWPIEWLIDNVYFFQFKNIEENIQWNPTRSSGVFRVSHVYDVLGQLSKNATIQEFVVAWQQRKIDGRSIGFFLK